jgi:hypothetical protein
MNEPPFDTQRYHSALGDRILAEKSPIARVATSPERKYSQVFLRDIERMGGVRAGNDAAAISDISTRTHVHS